MEHKYNLEKIFVSWLSYRGIPFFMPPKSMAINNGGDYDIASSPSKSTMTKGNVAYYKNGVYMPLSIGDVDIPYAVISISRDKNIVQTSLSGRTGTVKELISLNDSSIDITGMLVGKERQYPENEVETINQLYERNEAVDIISALTSILFGVDVKIVIESISYPPLQGVEDVQIIKIKCVTDAPFELKIK